MTSPKTILPDEIKKLIEDEAEKKIDDKYHDDKTIAIEKRRMFMFGATSLYQHLSEQDGELGEKRRWLKECREAVVEHVKTIQVKDKEIERLKKILNDKLYWLWKGSDTSYSSAEWIEQFKTENNL